MPVVRDVNPIVQGVAEVADPALWLSDLESGEEDPAHIGAKIAVRVLEVEEVRRRRGDDSSVPQGQALELENSVGEDDRVVPLSRRRRGLPGPGSGCEAAAPAEDRKGSPASRPRRLSPPRRRPGPPGPAHTVRRRKSLTRTSGRVLEAGQRLLRRKGTGLGVHGAAREQQAGQETGPLHGR